MAGYTLEDKALNNLYVELRMDLSLRVIVKRVQSLSLIKFLVGPNLEYSGVELE